MRLPFRGRSFAVRTACPLGLALLCVLSVPGAAALAEDGGPRPGPERAAGRSAQVGADVVRLQLTVASAQRRYGHEWSRARTRQGQAERLADELRRKRHTVVLLRQAAARLAREQYRAGALPYALRSFDAFHPGSRARAAGDRALGSRLGRAEADTRRLARRERARSAAARELAAHALRLGDVRRAAERRLAGARQDLRRMSAQAMRRGHCLTLPGALVRQARAGGRALLPLGRSRGAAGARDRAGSRDTLRLWGNGAGGDDGTAWSDGPSGSRSSSHFGGDSRLRGAALPLGDTLALGRAGSGRLPWLRGRPLGVLRPLLSPLSRRLLPGVVLPDVVPPGPRDDRGAGARGLAGPRIPGAWGVIAPRADAASATGLGSPAAPDSGRPDSAAGHGPRTTDDGHRHRHPRRTPVRARAGGGKAAAGRPARDAGPGRGGGRRPLWGPPLASYALSAGFGSSGPRWAHRHTGQDFAVPVGSPVRSVGPGQVVSLGCAGPFGMSMLIRHPGGDFTQYAHLSTILAQPGERVRGGQWIALSGDTGNATGPHLHFEARRTREIDSAMDPVRWLRRHGVRV